MLFRCVAVILFFVPVALAINISLAHSECFDVNSTLTICAPPNQTINTTSVYAQCITDTNARLTSVNSTINTINANVLSYLTSANSSITSVCSAMNSEITTTIFNLSQEVKKVQGITFAENYASCLVNLNTTQKDLTKFQEELRQRTAELGNKIDVSQLNECKNATSSFQTELQKKAQEQQNNLIIGLLIGAGGMFAYFRREPKEDLDTRGGRPMIPGRR